MKRYACQKAQVWLIHEKVTVYWTPTFKKYFLNLRKPKCMKKIRSSVISMSRGCSSSSAPWALHLQQPPAEPGGAGRGLQLQVSSAVSLQDNFSDQINTVIIMDATFKIPFIYKLYKYCAIEKMDNIFQVTTQTSTKMSVRI